MFPTYDQNRALVADRFSRFEAAASRRRFLAAGRKANGASLRRRDRATTPVSAVGAAARKSISLGRTPSETRRAA